MTRALIFLAAHALIALGLLGVALAIAHALEPPQATVLVDPTPADFQECRPIRTGPLAPTRPVDPYARKKDIA